MRFTLFWGWRKKKRPVVAAFNPKSRNFAADSGSAGEDARVPRQDSEVTVSNIADSGSAGTLARHGCGRGCPLSQAKQ